MPWQLTVKERWFCRWCYAWTELGFHPQEASRPQYQPIAERWERAESGKLSRDVAHAYGFGATLCGITHDGLTASPYLWMTTWPDACQACMEAAAVIDQRWPLEKRGNVRVNPIPPPDSDWPPF